MDLQNKLDLRDFASLAFAFVEQDMLDYNSFLDLSRKALLLNSHMLNIQDLSMLLTIAQKLEKTESKYFPMFSSVMAECLEIVVPDLNMSAMHSTMFFYNAMTAANEVIGFKEFPKLSLIFDAQVAIRLE